MLGRYHEPRSVVHEDIEASQSGGIINKYVSSVVTIRRGLILEAHRQNPTIVWQYQRRCHQISHRGTKQCQAVQC